MDNTLLTRLPETQRDLHKTMDAFFKDEGFGTVRFEESVWKRAGGGKYQY